MDNYIKESDYVNFGDLVRSALNQQCQYASRYVGGHCDYPDLGKGLRFIEHGKVVKYADDYHALMIHKDDVKEFLSRVIIYRHENGLT